MTNIAITILVAIHLAVAVWHGNAHTELAIALPPEKNAFVIMVILIAPLVAAALMWTRYVLVGLWLFFLSMLGALLFGAYHHYIWYRLTTLVTCRTAVRTLTRRSLPAPGHLPCSNWPQHYMAHSVWGRARQGCMAQAGIG